MHRRIVSERLIEFGVFTEDLETLTLNFVPYKHIASISHPECDTIEIIQLNKKYAQKLYKVLEIDGL